MLQPCWHTFKVRVVKPTYLTILTKVLFVTAMLAYLYDAYEEDDLNQRNVLHLHSNLAPVKLMVSTEDKNSEGQLEVAKRFLKELRVAGT